MRHTVQYKHKNFKIHNGNNSKLCHATVADWDLKNVNSVTFTEISACKFRNVWASWRECTIYPRHLSLQEAQLQITEYAYSSSGDKQINDMKLCIFKQ